KPTGHFPYEHGMIGAIATLLLGAALLAVYREKMALPEHVRQYDGIGAIYKKAHEKLSNAKITPAEEAEKYLELGEQALQENGDWLLLHRDRPLEVIVP